MLHSDSWRELAAQYTALSVASHDGLWADWHYILKSGTPPEWQIKGRAAFVIEFETLAIRGATLLGNGESTDLLATWLELLKKELHSFRYGPVGVEKDEDGAEGAHHVTATMPNLCSASARMCKELEKRALQKEFASRQSSEKPLDRRSQEPNPPNYESKSSSPQLTGKLIESDSGFDSSDDNPGPLASQLIGASVGAEYGRLRPNQRIWKKKGDSWIVSFEGKTELLKDALGMVYLSYLLNGPGKEIPAPEMIAAAGGQTSKPPKSSAGEIADPRAVSEYKLRAQELAADIEQADKNNDSERAAILRNEFKKVTHAIMSAKGLGGRRREFGDTGERARKSVAQALRRAIKSIRRTNVALAQHLEDRVQFGVSLLYKGDEIPWNSA